MKTCMSALMCLLALAPGLAAKVIVVAKSGGDFTSIQAAIDASSDGDTLLVRSGPYLASRSTGAR